MIHSLGTATYSSQRITTPDAGTDPLAARRADEGRKLAMAALQADHQKKIEVAVQSYVAMQELQSAGASAGVTTAARAYSEF